MKQDARDFLEALLRTPSVSGFEVGIQKVVRERLSAQAESINGDVHGNLIGAVNENATKRVMLSGHCDQIGFMVTHVDDKGFILFREVGGIDASVLPGTRIIIHTATGPVDGIIGHKPVHLIPQAERGKSIDIKKLWIDIGSTNTENLTEKVQIGDPITFSLGMHCLGEHLISAAGCDNRIGLFVVVEAFLQAAEKIKAQGSSSPVALYVASTVQEELGLRGARTASYSINPLVGIAVDVTHASDNPGVEAKEIGKILLGKGPSIARGANINPVIENLLVASATKNKIPVQRLAAPSATGTDANAIQISRAGVATALVGIPNRYMHTPVEVVDLRDIEAAIALLVATILAITPEMDFVPV